MGRTRPKVKTYAKKAQWARGQSSTSNPDKNKHRLKALSKFGQPILNTRKCSTSHSLKSDEQKWKNRKEKLIEFALFEFFQLPSHRQRTE